MDHEKSDHSAVLSPAVSKMLDAASDEIKPEFSMYNGVIKKTDKSEHQRAKGRPKGGRARIGITLIKALPETGYCPEIAEALRVERQTVIQWTQRKANPLPCHCEDGKRLFRKKDVIKFLIATRRYKPKAEYGE